VEAKFMKILIIGTGYVGTTTGLVFCELGYNVTGLDVDEEKLKLLQSGKLHFYEPGLNELLLKHINNGKINFTNDTEMAIKENDVIFICVGTPQGNDGSADLRYVKEVSKSIGKYINNYKVIVDKSTVPVGTAEKVTKWIKGNLQGEIPFDVVSNPEFLREGSALRDALNPDRIVIGSSSEQGSNIMKEIYSSFNCPIVETSPKAAELIKYAANSFLALKISYINEIAKFCDSLDINVNDISRGMGLDHRIGQKFLQAGIGYGGSCFPKDVNALLKLAEDNNLDLNILNAAVKVNDGQINYFINKIKNKLGNLNNKTIAILGLAFKAHTDDIREAPSLKLINLLKSEDCKIKVHDPVVELKMAGVTQYSKINELVENVDATIVCTDWPEYKELNWVSLKAKMKGHNIFDGRNMLDKEALIKNGYQYFGIGG
jgi:UDPglucose 6-dehydrogenase